MKYEIRTKINGRRIFLRVDYKRDIKKIIDDWKLLYGDAFTYLDICPEVEKYTAIVRKPKRQKEKPKGKRQIIVEIRREEFRLPKAKTWLEKYGT
jgi:hypothetical protein